MSISLRVVKLNECCVDLIAAAKQARDILGPVDDFTTRRQAEVIEMLDAAIAKAEKECKK